MSKRRSAAAASFIVVSALALAACAGTPSAAPESAPASSDAGYYPVTVTDLAGNEVTIESADAVAVTDNRFFQLAADWDLPVVAAPRDLMSPNNPLAAEESVLNVGTHREPDFEQIVAADPDLIINGYRFGAETAEGVTDAAPDAAFVSMDLPEGETMGVDEYTVESLTLLGEIFNKQEEAEALIDDFHTALDAAKSAYDPATTVMGLLTSGGEINYANPEDGRGASIFFDLLELTPALDTSGSTGDTGDSISLEALAEADADYFIVLDRDAAVGEEGVEATPALELINGSAALTGVPAVVNEAIYVYPADYYLTEDVFAYVTVLDGLATLFGEQ